MTTENCLECTERHGTDVDERFHLLAQIKFLHSELERLESQCETIRLNRHRESSESARNTGDIINRKNRELLELRQKYDYLNNVSNKELQKRCTSLEKQLASALSVNAITLNERDELGAKVRKLDSALKSRKTELIEFQLTCAEDIKKKDAEICELSAAVKEAVASAEHALAAQHLSVAVATCNVGTNTESQAVSVLSQTESVILAEKECQVNSEPHFSDLSTQAASTVAHALELKTQECDDIRAKFEDLVSLHEDALHKLGTAHRQLSDETERHKLCNADAEKLGIHLRSLQQRNSEQNTTERDLTSKLLHLEEQLQHLRSESIRGERDRSVLESQIRQYEVDMSQLVQNKNFSNEQLSALANENEQLRAEVQKLLQRESQLAFTLKAKDGELHDIIAAYQNSAKENETTVDNKRALERELDQSNAVLASKQEEIIYLQEQLHALHQREQQLVLDTQTFEYENSQHHRRIIQLEASISQFELRCAEMHQALLAKNQAAEEIHQNLAEVSKELVIKDNECLLMKRHYESLEADATRLQALVVSHEQRQHALEDTNARLVARDILSATTDITAISSDLAACQQELATAKTELLNEVGKKTALKAALRDVELKLKETTQSNDRLKQIVSDQTKALSHLAK